MIEYEFYEIIFLVCKKYFNKYLKKGTYLEYKEALNLIMETVNKLEPIKLKKYNYSYPLLTHHKIYKKRLDEERQRIEEEKNKIIL